MRRVAASVRTTCTNCSSKRTMPPSMMTAPWQTPVKIDTSEAAIRLLLLLLLRLLLLLLLLEYCYCPYCYCYCY